MGRVLGVGFVGAWMCACSGGVFKPSDSAPDTSGAGDSSTPSNNGDTVVTRPQGTGGKPNSTGSGGKPSTDPGVSGGAGEGAEPVGGGAQGGTAGAGGSAPQGGSTTQGGANQGGTANGGAGRAGANQGGTTGQAGASQGGTTHGGAGQGGTAGSGGSGGQGMGGGSNPSVCTSPVVEGWTAPIGATGSGSAWEVAWGDPTVDTVNHRLVVTYDDVASRAKHFVGSYYVSAIVTLTGGTVLTANPYSNEGVWPSLRRSGSGENIELGRTFYGQTQIWTSTGWPSAGVSFAAAQEVKLTTYVKASAKAVASKVTVGNSVYRSAWVSGFTWANTDMSILRYIGENNSRVYSGDAIYVGPLSGCEGLTDGAVETLFNN